jgi:Bifunctional DNA primase/polymerase, N-terminal
MSISAAFSLSVVDQSLSDRSIAGIGYEPKPEPIIYRSVGHSLRTDQYGARFLPVAPDSKRALLPDWPNEAVPYGPALGRWRKRGLRIGMTLPGLVAIDLDPVAAYMGLSLELGDLAPTWQQATPRGGRHYVYAVEGSNGGIEQKQRQRIAWRQYPEGQVDIKAGPGSFIVLYETVPGPAAFAPLPEAIAEALARETKAGALASVLLSPASWEELAAATERYRTSERVLELLVKDRRVLAGTPPGEQSATLNKLAFNWGRSIRRGFLSASSAEGQLVMGGMAMVNAPGREPWTQDGVRGTVRRGMLAGYARAG